MDYAESTRLIYTPENQYGKMEVSALTVAVVTGCRAPGLKTTNQAAFAAASEAATDIEFKSAGAFALPLVQFEPVGQSDGAHG